MGLLMSEEGTNQKNDHQKNSDEQKKWYKRLPHPYILLFLIVIFATVLTYVVPAGEFEREEIDGTEQVVAGTFEFVEQNPVGPFEMLRVIPEGLSEASDVVFIVFIAGAMFHTLQSTGAIESGVGVLVKKLKTDKQTSDTKIIWLLVMLFGLLGAVVGFENNIALIPIGVVLSLALGFDLLTGAAISIGSIGIGFAASPINVYTVGVSHDIAELPTFSGFGLRSLFFLACLIVLAHHISKYARKVKEDPDKSLTKGINTEGLKLSKEIHEYELTKTHKAVLAVLLGVILTIVMGTLVYEWFIPEISTVFIVGAVLSGLIARYSADKILNTMLEGAANLTKGALIIGVAQGISLVLERGNVQDTIAWALAKPLENFPAAISGMLMSLVHGVINFFLPSGSGQAMATMPIMVPISDLVGLTRQTAVLAFQIGDGIMNMMIPTLGGLLAMLALARVPFDKWFRFVLPLMVKIVLVGWVFTIIAVAINWGPA